MRPGEVYSIFSQLAGKKKYHLCVNTSGAFLFLNSPKPKTYEGDLMVDCADLPFLPPTSSGKSIVSCSTVVPIDGRDLARHGELVGAAPRSLLAAVFDFVEEADFLSEEDREVILSGLDGWL